MKLSLMTDISAIGPKELKHKMKDEVSLVDITDRSGAVNSEKPCQQPSVIMN